MDHSLMQDYSQHFVNRGSLADRPANFIKDEAEEDRTGGDPTYAAYVTRTKAIVAEANLQCPYMAKKVDLTPESGQNGETDLLQLLTTEDGQLMEFDVILIDPPWREYRDRSAAATLSAGIKAASTSYSVWNASELAKLPIERLAAEPCLVFLWCGAGEHVAEGHNLLREWGFHLVEDIVWLQTNKTHPNLPGYTSEESVFQKTFEHCLMGLRGRSFCMRDTHLKVMSREERMEWGMVQFMNAGCDIDIIIAESEESGSTAKPHNLYDLIERFCAGRRRLELFGTDHNLRNGWLTLGMEISHEVENFDLQHYKRRFDQPVESKIVVQPPEPFDARIGGAYLPFDLRAEELRPKSPPMSGGVRIINRPKFPRKGWTPITQIARNKTTVALSPAIHNNGQTQRGLGEFFPNNNTNTFTNNNLAPAAATPPIYPRPQPPTVRGLSPQPLEPDWYMQ